MPVKVRSLHDTWSILSVQTVQRHLTSQDWPPYPTKEPAHGPLSRAVGQVLAEGRVADHMRQMYPASSEARKATAAAISTGSGNQPRAGWVLLDRQRSGSEC